MTEKEWNELNASSRVDEKVAPQKPKMSFEEACKACNAISIDQFFQEWHKIIENDNRLI